MKRCATGLSSTRSVTERRLPSQPESYSVFTKRAWCAARDLLLIVEHDRHFVDVSRAMFRALHRWRNEFGVVWAMVLESWDMCLKCGLQVVSLLNLRLIGAMDARSVRPQLRKLLMPVGTAGRDGGIKRSMTPENLLSYGRLGENWFNYQSRLLLIGSSVLGCTFVLSMRRASGEHLGRR